MPPELPPLEAIRHVHLIAVAGTGMGSLACMLADQGFRVTGSDLDIYPPMSDQLRDAAIEVQKGYVADHVLREPPDLVLDLPLSVLAKAVNGWMGQAIYA